MSITDAIRSKKLKQLQSSQTFLEVREKRASIIAQSIKTARLNGTLNGEGMSSEDALRRAYYRMYEEYTGKTQYSFHEEENEKSKKLWARVAKRQAESGVPEVEFMQAQFAWFHKNFGKAPTFSQLSTEAAVARAKEYVPSLVSKRIVGNGIEVTVDFAHLMRNSEKQMQQLMTAQNKTREEVYRDLVLTGLFSFPKEFLQADPVYRKVKEEE